MSAVVVFIGTALRRRSPPRRLARPRHPRRRRARRCARRSIRASLELASVVTSSYNGVHVLPHLFVVLKMRITDPEQV